MRTWIWKSLLFGGIATLLVVVLSGVSVGSPARATAPCSPLEILVVDTVGTPVSSVPVEVSVTLLRMTPMGPGGQEEYGENKGTTDASGRASLCDPEARARAKDGPAPAPSPGASPRSFAMFTPRIGPVVAVARPTGWPAGRATKQAGSAVIRVVVGPPRTALVEVRTVCDPAVTRLRVWPFAELPAVVRDLGRGRFAVDGLGPFPYGFHAETCEGTLTAKVDGTRLPPTVVIQGAEPSAVPDRSRVRFVDLTAGSEHTCLRTDRGDAWCWGAPSTANGCPRGPVAVRSTCATGAVEVTAGSGFTCARSKDGAVRCWGDADRRELGTKPDASGVARVPIPEASQISAGSFHACAVLRDGTVQCWGWNAYRQIDGQTEGETLAPTAVAGLSGVAQVAAGSQHSCARKKDGTVLCWGSTLHHAIGTPAAGAKWLPPTVVPGITGAVELVAGGSRSCARSEDGTVRCWGSDLDGTAAPPTPVEGVNGSTRIALGGYHGCTVLADKTVSCWGLNHDGQLGDGTEHSRPHAAPVPGLSDVVAIGLGDRHSCALTGSGATFCWGENRSNQLGDGRGGGPASSRMPVRLR